MEESLEKKEEERGRREDRNRESNAGKKEEKEETKGIILANPIVKTIVLPKKMGKMPLDVLLD